MRLLVLTHRLPYAPNRGDRLRAFHLLKLLGKEHEVHLVSLVHDADEAARVATLDLGLASARGARVPRLRTLLRAVPALPTTRPLTHVLLNSPALQKLLRDVVHTSQPHAVLAYCTGMAQHVFDEPLASLPFVLDMVDVDSEKWAALARVRRRPMSWVYAREADVLRAFERRVVMSATATTVVSDREQALAERVLGVSKPITVAPNGIDLRAFAPKHPPPASETVVFCGVFSYGPNEEAARWLATEVWPRVKAAQPTAVLQLVGMDPSRAMQALASPGSIEVTGALPDVRPYLWGAAAAAAPLTVARGVQNKALEAVAAGVPCVVTPAVFEGLPAAIRGATPVADSASAFAEALVAVLRLQPPERRKTASAVDFSSLSWQTQLEPLLAHVRQLAVSHR